MLRRKAVNKYYSSLYGLLRVRYGISGGYSINQIEATIKECELPMKYMPYALALFVDETSLQEHLSKEYPELDALQLRSYIAKRFFKGDIDYKYRGKELNTRLQTNAMNTASMLKT